jgi:hypothetical protein
LGAIEVTDIDASIIEDWGDSDVVGILGMNFLSAFDWSTDNAKNQLLLKRLANVYGGFGKDWWIERFRTLYTSIDGRKKQLKLAENLGAVVGILPGVVGYRRQNCSFCCTVALEFVGDDPERLPVLTAHQPAKESLGCALIAAGLQQNINHISVLINGTPEILLLAVDSDEQFIQIPDVAKATLFPLQPLCIAGSEFSAPLSDRFERDNDSTFGQEIFDITEAHTETMIDPHGIADDFRWESVSTVAGSGGLHGLSLSAAFPI